MGEKEAIFHVPKYFLGIFELKVHEYESTKCGGMQTFCDRTISLLIQGAASVINQQTIGNPPRLVSSTVVKKKMFTYIRRKLLTQVQ